MIKLFVSLILIFNLGIGNKIEKTFNKKDTKYIEKHIRNVVVIQMGPQNSLLSHNEAVNWFYTISKDPSILSFSVKKCKDKDEFNYVMNVTYIEKGILFYHPIYFDIYKGKILRIKG